MLAFVGRTEPLARLTAAYQALAAPAGTVSGWAGLVLVIGEAGIGKTTLLTRFARRGQSRRWHGRMGHVLGRGPGTGVVAVDPGATRTT